MDLTDILRAVKDGKMDLKTEEQHSLSLGFVSYTGLQNLILTEKTGQELLMLFLQIARSLKM